jgi:hypothetical protein
MIVVTIRGLPSQVAFENSVRIAELVRDAFSYVQGLSIKRDDIYVSLPLEKFPLGLNETIIIEITGLTNLQLRVEAMKVELRQAIRVQFVTFLKEEIRECESLAFIFRTHEDFDVIPLKGAPPANSVPP